MRVFLTLCDALWQQSAHIKFRLIVGMLLILVSSSLNLSLPWYFKWMIDQLSIDDPVQITSWIFAVYGTLWLLSQLLMNIRQIIVYRVFEGGIHRFCYQIFAHLLTMDIPFFHRNSTGAVTNSIERAQFAIPTVLAGLLFTIIPTFLEVILAVLLIFLVYGWLCSGTVGIMLLGYILFTVLTLDIIVRAQRKGNEQYMAVSEYVTDVLINIESLYYQSGQATACNKVDSLLQDREDALTKQLVISDVVGFGQKLITGLGLLTVTIWTGHGVIQGTLTIGDFVLFNGYILQFIYPLNMIGLVINDLRSGLTKMEDVVRIMHEKRVIIEKPDAIEASHEPMGIEFHNVGFSYPEQNRRVISGVNFNIAKGQTLAIIGSNGAGKSTITKLLYRFYDPNDGKILIGGHDIKHLKLDYLRNLIGVVPQEILLFNDTIQNNLTLGKPNVSGVDEVLEVVGLREWIAQLPKQLDTLVGERGVLLSGGQRKRIGIARTLLTRPQILILDEADASLDVDSAYQLIQHLQTTYSKLTKVVITHNDQFSKIADQVINLNDSRPSQ